MTTEACPTATITLPPLTEEQKAQALAALDRARELRERLLASRGGRLFSSSGEILSQICQDIEDGLE